MSNKKEKQGVKEAVDVQEVPAPSAPTEEAPKYSLRTWGGISKAKLGVPSYVLAGALHDKEMDDEFTEEEILSAVEKFLNTPAS